MSLVTPRQFDFSDCHFLANLLGECPSESQLKACLGRLVLAIEERLSLQLSGIIEAPEFSALESYWRGVESLIWEIAGDTDIKVKILDFCWHDVGHDLHQQTRVKNSHLYRLIGANELETMGGEPFGVLFVDHGINMSLLQEYDDVYTAQLLSELGQACMCPIVAGVSQDFTGYSDAEWATDLQRIEKVLHSEDYQSWQLLRQGNCARYLALVLPEIQLRGRYTDLDLGFRFHQWPSQSSGLWGNGAYALLRTIICEYKRCAWFGFLKLIGNESGRGAVLGPITQQQPKGTVLVQRAKIRMHRDMAQFYSEQGFIPIAESTRDHRLYVYGNRSVADCDGNPQQAVVTQLQSVMIACRLVHYIKIQIRHLIGQLKTASECELILNNWLDNYVTHVAEADADILARFPLKDATVEVVDGSEYGAGARFGCKILLKPQYQIDHIVGEIALSTEVGGSSVF